MKIVEWEIFKQFIDQRKLSVQYIDVGHEYILKGFDNHFSLECHLNKSSHIEEIEVFENEYKDNGNKPFTENGFPISSPTFEYDFGLNAIWKGYKYLAIAGAHNFYDEVITTQLKLRGGWYSLLDNNANLGDYIEFSIVDKDDVLGYFQYFGLTVGVDVLELSKYVKTEYIDPTNRSRQVFTASSAADVAAGLYFRVGYKSTGNEDVNFRITIHYLED